MILYAHFESPLGSLLLTSSEDALTGLYFVGQTHAPQISPDWVQRDDAEIFVLTLRQIEEYATGERDVFELPLCLEGTDFQRRVWREIGLIPFGHTITYSELAKRIGSERAVRAVGTATGQNPVSWIIPCHRVVGKDGALTGYAGGVLRKSALLDFETARLKGRKISLVFDDAAAALK